MSAPAPRESCKNSEEEVEKNEKKRHVKKNLSQREREALLAPTTKSSWLSFRFLFSR